MQYASLVLAVASAAVVAAQAALTVNTPASVVQCQPVQLSWSGGTAPYYVSIIPGGQAGAAALESFPTQTGTSYTWNVDLAAGTSITVQIRDNTGTINYSDKTTIQAGTSTSCSASSGSTTAAAAGAGASSSAAAGTTAAASSADSAASTGGSGASRAAASVASGASSAASSAASTAASATTSKSAGEKLSAGAFTVAAGALLALFA